MAREDMALRLDETSSTVDTIQHDRAWHDRPKRCMVSQVRWREEHRNRVIRSVEWEDVRNVILPRRMLLIVIFLIRWTQHVGIVGGRATGSNFVEQPFQYHGFLNRQSSCCIREQELVDPLGRRLELSLLEFRSGGSSNTLGHTRCKAST